MQAVEEEARPVAATEKSIQINIQTLTDGLSLFRLSLFIIPVSYLKAIQRRLIAELVDYRRLLVAYNTDVCPI